MTSASGAHGRVAYITAKTRNPHQHEHHGVERLQQPRSHEHNNLNSSLAKLSSGYPINKATTADYASVQQLIGGARAEVSRDRGQLGAVQNRFQSTIANLQVSSQNLTASESQIADTDMSLEMVNFTDNQILLQTGTACSCRPTPCCRRS